MTRNQIEFANYVEAKRSNKAREAETYRNNLVTSNEINRSNLEKERVQRGTLKVQQGTLKETRKHNRASERIEKVKARETIRSNKAREKETVRSNKAAELNTRYTADQGRLGHENAANIAAQASRDAANINAAASRYTADSNAAASRYSANTNAAAHKYSADVQKQIAQLNNIQQKWNQQQENLRRYSQNATQKQIAEEDRKSRELQNYNTRLHDAISTNNSNAQEQVRNEIERWKVEIQKAYNEGKITAEYWRNALQTTQELEQLMQMYGTGTRTPAGF